ncbi:MULTISPECIES: transketolase family protein [Anaerotruncus]|jgi:transketolase|uniref:transketolase family protein n=1 Tax=Anaerotruncus TaxID=244127 RepID=UPI000E545A1A|nr:MULTISPECIES: transketolase C-terminal domain-containing protein [Anaerotruncus]RGX56267.1 transketolase [Anaerotruncus sp. AF02-27]
MMKYSGSREAFTAALLDIAEKDDRAMLVSADSLKAMRATKFAEQYPDRYVECGISEQDAVLVASGLASCGLVPFVGTYGGFITMRACEQMRTYCAYPNMNVKLIGINGGLLGGEREGVTHQFIEDLGIVRTIPNITVLTPADQYQVYGAVKAAMEIDGPVYVRCASGREPVVYDESVPFTFGKIRVLKNYGDDVAIFAAGYLMNRAVQAAEDLKAQGISATLVDVSTLKPIDEQGVAEVLARCKRAVTVEDHNVIGGLGSAIAETAAKLCPTPMAFIGVQDRFAESGAADALLDAYGMSANAIVKAAKELCSR